MRSQDARFRLSFSALAFLGVAALGTARPAEAQKATADVVVLVDTSTSMRDEGMDPQWTSLLVTKLLTDIVPGELAVVRLLDVKADGDVLPSRETGKFEPCVDDPNRQCAVVEATSDWNADARRDRLGTEIRPSRGDPAFKKRLESHLERRINNSMFYLAFAAARGVFDQHGAGPGREAAPRTVIWLSDGRSELPPVTERRIHELLADGAAIKAVVFGRGDTSLAERVGLDPLQVSTPAEIMRAFADAFRQIVQAPFRIDNTLATAPSFEMKPHVDEAWVVVYGDDTLGEVTLDGPGGTRRANYASDRWEGAGAYRVAYLERPAAGSWKVDAAGGGGGVAYAVVQRSALTPVLLAPTTAISGTEVTLVGGVRAGLEGELISAPEVLRGLTFTAEVQGQTLTLRDDGTGGDATAGDGRFSAPARFRDSGRVPVALHLAGDLVDRRGEAVVEVSGEFLYTGGPVSVDLGRLGVDAESCRQLVFSAKHQGELGFELERRRSLPSGHGLEVRLPRGTLRPGGEAQVAAPGDRFEVCLATSAKAPSSEAAGELWLELRVAGSDLDEHLVPIHLSWQVEGLSFWQRWGWLILWILAVLTLLVLIAGYVVPQRFSGNLAVAYVPERDELDEQTAQPVKQWPGVGVGFYRNARAFLHPDFRLSGKLQGSIASLHAERGGARAQPDRSQTLHRETLDGDWERVASQGRRARPGDVYRVGEQGPFFRIAAQRGRR